MQKALISILSILLFYTAYSQEPIQTVLQKGHSRYVTCVDISADGKYAITGSADNTLKLWNIKSGKEIRNFTMHTEAIRSVFFNAEGTKIVSASNDNKAIVYDVIKGKVLAEMQIDNKLEKACFTPDGSKVITADDRNLLSLWDANTGQLIGDYKKHYSAVISKQSFTNDGNAFLQYVDRNEMVSVNLQDSAAVISFKADKPYDYAISPNNKYVAIATEKKEVLLFDLKTGEKLRDLNATVDKPCDGCKSYLVFSHNSKYMATASKYAPVTIWDIKTGKVVAQFETDADWFDELKFSPNDENVVLSADDEMWVWNIKSGKELLNLSFDGLECIPVISPDSKSILTTGTFNRTALWSLSSGKSLKHLGGYLNKEHQDGIPFKQGDWFHTNILRYLGLKSGITLSSDGKFLVKGSIDSTAFRLNLENGKVEKWFQGHTKKVISTDLSPDGKLLLTASADGKLKLWDVETGKLKRTYKGHSDLVFDARFSNDGTKIVSGSWDSSLRIWELETGKIHSSAHLDQASPYRVSFTPNDLYVLSSDLSEQLRMWEVDVAKQFRSLIGHTKLATDICYSPDGKYVLTASLDGMVKMWDLFSGMLVNKLSGHSSGVYSLAFAPNGEFIASGSNDRSIIIWDPTSGKRIRTLKAHSGAVSSIQIDAASQRMVSCSVDGEIIVWDMANYTQLYTYIQIDRDNWLAKTPGGYFDGTPEAIKNINYVSGLIVVAVESLFEKYYTPNLITRINAGEYFLDEQNDITTQINTAPSIHLNIHDENFHNHLSETDSVAWFQNQIDLTVALVDEGSGLDELRVFNNEKLVYSEQFSKSSIRRGKKVKQHINIAVAPGENNITAIAYSKQRTESAPSSIKIHYDGVETDAKLFILSVGVNKYKNPSYNLSYAVNDAKAYTKAIRKSSSAIFRDVEEVFLSNDEVSKESLTEAFANIALKSEPQDVFVFYYAGHGVMNLSKNSDEDFYIIPHDVTQMYGDKAMLTQKALSAKEMLELSKEIPARKQMFILDACQSGGALSTFQTRGGNREKAIAQLARSTGTYFLLASGAVQYASEAKELGHGIFTYAILEGLEGKADGISGDEKITANELRAYVEDRVPELTDKYMLTPQYPTGYSFGQDFPIVIVK
ncbi:caspase family protein [Carboxylicivirga sp. N1Y90]|uniref:caspase family protein n=1 Tax=Carboxylicivirga fragile TaxID=3417571 RepID=UPI003D33ACAD|nr:caspase family protein [Marinilabiliaceae bacterium N1Y90]